MKIQLIDCFNGSKISTHRNIENAVKAQRKHLAAVKRRNGQNSFLTYSFKYANGKSVDQELVMDAKFALDSKW